jgi:hypothetical protein
VQGHCDCYYGKADVVRGLFAYAGSLGVAQKLPAV